MNVSVDGYGFSAAEWAAIRDLPPEQLPALDKSEREVAQELGIPEAEYARSLLAGRRSQEALLKKAKSLGLLLEKIAGAIDSAAKVKSVNLRVFQGRFDIKLDIAGSLIPMSIDESLVDDYFSAGSREAEERLARIVERVLTLRPVEWKLADQSRSC
jgi:hypothetical protein